MSKALKVLSIILVVTMLLVASMGTISMADDESDASKSSNVVGGLFDNGNANTAGIEGIGANIVGIITTIGIIVAVVVLLVLGIKYMMGSAAEKAEYKKTMIPYLVGAVLIFGASAIARAVIAMSESITGTGS